MDLTEARRIEAPRWVNIRTVLGLLLFAVSVASGSSVLRSVDDGTLVWAAGQDLPEGAVLTATDVEPVRVDLPGVQLASYLGTAAPVGGLTLLRPLRQGELVPAGWVTEADSSSSRSIAVPITSDHAVGGAIRPGDRVDVFATLNGVRGRARTVLLVGEAEVEGLLRSQSLVMEGNSFAGLTLSVPPEEAARIAFAIRTADVDVVLVRGEASGAVVGSVSDGDL